MENQTIQIRIHDQEFKGCYIPHIDKPFKRIKVFYGIPYPLYFILFEALNETFPIYMEFTYF